jgi:predicted O-linked N-acetylglucosamine transferase (SPINDLY family)
MRTAEALPAVLRALEKGLEEHRRGNLAAAEASYRGVLRQVPGHPYALNLLGLLEHQRGRHAEARKWVASAIASHPREGRFHLNLANILAAEGRVEEALAAYREALRCDETLTEAYHNLGVALTQAGRVEEALLPLREATARVPADAQAHYNLGNAYSACGRHAEAAVAFERAVALAPAFAFAWHNLGNSRCTLGEIEQAAHAFRCAVGRAPDLAAAWVNLGNCETQLKHYGEARAAYEKAIALQPRNITALCGVGSCALELDDLIAAARAFEQAVAADPECARAYAGLAGLFRKAGRFRDAVLSCERAIAFDATLAKAHEIKAGALLDHGRAEQALAAFHRAAEIDGAAGYLSNIAFASNYVEELDPSQLLAAARAAAAVVERLPAWLPKGRVAQATRLRVGFVSGDLRRHSVGYFMAPVLGRIDRERFAIYCYYNSDRSDDMNAGFRSLGDTWVDCRQMTDPELAARIEADRVDVLVDLAGYTNGGRLGVFARHPAVVQCAYLGYPTTTGLQAMDYRITDAVVDPEDEPSCNAERLLRLSGSYFCYGGPQGRSADTAQPPALRNGFVTFGSFNNLAKLTPRAMQLWVRVVAAVPGSKLAIKSKALVDEKTCEDVVQRFEEAGMPRERLQLSGWKETTEAHLAAYNSVDIALDSWPYNGATTTCEALWMGVPVVSLAGKTHASRMGKSILRAAGCEAWACDTDERYVDRAVSLTADLAKLAEVRSGLRARLQQSALMDAEHFTRGLERGFEQMLESMG